VVASPSLAYVEDYMTTWIQCTGQTILQTFGIQFDSTRRCFERARDVGSHGGPWSFLLFVTEPTQLDMLTLCIATFDDEFLDAGFIPFTNQGGYVTLSRQEILGLIEVLEMQAALLSEAQPDTEPVFRELDSSDYAYYHLHPEWFPHSNQQYYQLIDNNTSTKVGDNITLLSFSTHRNFSNNELSFSITCFPDTSLYNTNFNPYDDGKPRINLNRTSIRALIELLREYLK
jgi:hypothetical protein